MTRLIATGVGVIATLALVAGCSVAPTDEDVSEDIFSVCHNGLAFAVYDGYNSGGIVRVPEWDVDC